MTNDTGGPNLYAIDACSEVRTILKISTEGTGILIMLQCFLGVVLELEANYKSFGCDIFLSSGRCLSPSHVASVRLSSPSCICAVLDSKRLRPRKLIGQLPLQLKTHFGYTRAEAGAPGTTGSVINGEGAIREMMPQGFL